MVAIHQDLMEAAAQGQSVFSASGDSGAYDINGSAPSNPDLGSLFSAQLSVTYPSSDPYVTSAGGTTAPVTVPLNLIFGCPNVTIPHEQVWGWDYVANACGIPSYYFFSTGGGGGVSSVWPLPYYQQFVSGITQTQPGQSLICYTSSSCAMFDNNNPPPQTLVTLPANFVGRNTPDLSLNADPLTGYMLVACTDAPPPACAETFVGGTSFVAPQLNGITALIDQASSSRVGLLNPVIYMLQSVFGYGKYTPFNDITAGDNWFYDGIPGYDNGSGIGSINAANLALTYVFLNSLGFRR